MASLSKVNSNKFVTMKSLRNLRPWFKDAASSDVQDVIDQLEKLKREKIDEEGARAVRFSAHTGHYDKHESHSCPQLKSMFDPQDVLEALIDRFSCRSRHYRSARVKYRFHDLQGNLCEWSGQGREPIKLREVLAATGKSRDEFLVQDDDKGHLNACVFAGTDNSLYLESKISNNENFDVTNTPPSLSNDSDSDSDSDKDSA